MRYFLTLVAGLILGALLTFYFYIGRARTNYAPGAVVQAPEASGDPPGTVVLMLDEKFFDALLGSLFRDLGSPTFNLTAMNGSSQNPGSTQNPQTPGCLSQVVLAPEGGGVRTGVQFVNGQIIAPLAFSGKYELFGNCYNFHGSAQAAIRLFFKPEEQTLYGQLNVEGVNPEGMPVIFSVPITAFVQNALNQRVNPLVLLRASQINLSLPVQASNGKLTAQAKEVRAEIKDGALRLHINYDFKGTRDAVSEKNL